MSAETLTSYDVWRKILGGKPIDLVFPFDYSPVPSGKPGERIGARRPSGLRLYCSTEEFLWTLRNWERREPERWKGTDTLLGVTSIVGVGIAQEEEWEHVLAGGYVDYDDWLFVRDWEPKEERSLLFIDMEIPYSDKTTGMIIDKIVNMRIDGYLLRSDKAYHLISDELTRLDELPARYGKLINVFAGDEPRWQWARDIGNALINAQDKEDVKRVCNYILNRIGHYGEEGERWFLIDLRYIAHSLLEFPILRISSKEGYPIPPTLLARFKDGKVKIYFQSPAPNQSEI